MMFPRAICLSPLVCLCLRVGERGCDVEQPRRHGAIEGGKERLQEGLRGGGVYSREEAHNCGGDG